ncbi:aKG-HExxH-type peptide beta-hydroxylase [Nocardia sp. NPDC055321]
MRGSGRLETVLISAGEIDALAMLDDDPGTPALMRRARSSRTLAFLAGVATALGETPPERTARAGLDTLIAVQRLRPRVVRDVVRHPRFGAWAAICATEMHTPGGRAPAGVAHLASFAATAAARAGLAAELDVPRVGDAVVLPGLGCWSGHTAPIARVRTGPGGAVLPGRDWTPLRRLTAHTRFGAVAVEFDDLPPTASAWPEVVQPVRDPWERWPDTDFERWNEVFADALALLCAAVPELAAPLCRGLYALVPLSRRTCPFTSSTLVDAFGTAATLAPGGVAGAATGLLHEFQHSKLSVLMELTPLIAVDGPADLPSPWRADPRPASGLLHGIYAHAAVARFWRRAATLGVRESIPSPGSLFEQTLAACETLTRSGRLTPIGSRFVDIMRYTVLSDIDSAGFGGGGSGGPDSDDAAPQPGKD